MANWPVQQVGSAGENVRSVQHLLNAQGASLAVDGDFGPATQSAVQEFQTDHGLTADGIVGNQTWPVLLVQVQSGSTGDAVAAVQSQIRSRIGSLTVDGVFGPETDETVRGFQGPIGLQVDGIVGPATWNHVVNGYLTAPDGDDAAERVFQAWTQNDKAGAAKNATPEAVAGLFAQSWSPNTWTFVACSGAAGSIFCSWNRSGGGQLVLRANDNVGAPFYFVTEVRF